MDQFHARRLQGAVPLASVAGKAGHHAVGPGADPSQRARGHVVDGHVLGGVARAAVLAGIAVPTKQISAREHDPRPGESVTGSQDDHLGDADRQ